MQANKNVKSSAIEGPNIQTCQKGDFWQIAWYKQRMNVNAEENEEHQKR